MRAFTKIWDQKCDNKNKRLNWELRKNMRQYLHFALNHINFLPGSGYSNPSRFISLNALYGLWLGAGAHTLGFSHCSRFANRVYNFSHKSAVDPTLDVAYADDLRSMCPKNVDPRIAIDMDPTTPRTFDHVYYKNLQNGKGLFSSDQVLFTDPRSKPAVNAFASSVHVFNDNFVAAITRLGRVGIKNAKNGNIRRDCSVLDWLNLNELMVYFEFCWLFVHHQYRLRATIPSLFIHSSFRFESESRGMIYEWTNEFVLN